MTEKTYSSVFDAIYEDDTKMAAEMKFRSDLLMVLGRIFEKNNWDQKDIMANLDVKQSRASELQNERINKFSSDKLIGYLSKAGYTIETELDIDQSIVRTKTVPVKTTGVAAV